MDPSETAAAADTGRILVERDGPLLRMTIDRPAKLNGFTPEMAEALARAYTLLEHDPALRVGLVQANGRAFTAGLDLPRWTERMRRREDTFPPELVDPFDLREPRRTKPVVFAVHGLCWTLGIELMLAADVVVASEDASFAQLEVLRGIMATGGATVRIAERAGIGNAMKVLLTGDAFDAPTALAWGLVQELAPPGETRARAEAIARRIAAAAPLAVRETILSVRAAAEQGPQAAIARFREVQARLAATEDAAEGVAAFRERRPPRFSGR